MDFRLNEHGVSLSGSSMDVNLKQRAQVISELSEKQKELQESLRRKLVELRKLCLQEAELTGHVPDDFPLEYGERPPVVSRRPKATFRVNAATVTRAEELQLERLERDFVVQLQMAEAARKLSLAAEQNVEMNSEQRRKRRLVYLDALQRLQELEEQSNNLRRKLGLRPVHRDPSNLIDEAHPSENSSLSESSSYEDILGQGARPSPPRISEHSHNVSNSPERRMGWKSSPVVLHSDVHNRRNSMASAASPTRSFPRSLSSLEGRSVPATPILSRNSCSSSALRSEGPGLSQRQWSGSQDSQVGFPSDRPSGHAARSRRSNSSEALIERPPPSEGPAKPSFNSSETLSENPQSGTVPPQQRGARSLDTRTPSNSRLSYEEILLDYYMERQQPRGWTEPEGQWFAEPDGSGHYSRRDGFPGSPAIRSRFEMQQQRRNAARTKSCGPQLADVGSFPQSWHHESFPQRPPPQASYPGPRSRSQPRAPPPETLERSVHKALALEGLRDWYLRNSAATSALHRCPVSSQMQNQRYYRPPYTDGHYQAASPLSHSISFTGAPMHGRHLSEYLGQEWCSQANIQGDGASEGTPPGTLV